MTEDSESERKDVVDTKEARLLVAEHEARVIDIRDPDAFAERRIAGAVNEPDLDPESFGEEDGDLRILVVCEDGEQSREVASKLRDQDVDAASLEGGMKAWQSDRLPTQPTTDPEEGEREPPKLPGAGV